MSFSCDISKLHEAEGHFVLFEPAIRGDGVHEPTVVDVAIEPDHSKRKRHALE
jgi:hypothetical protein